MTSNLTVDNVTKTTVELSWSSNETVEVLREQLVDGTYWPEIVVGETSNTSFVDDTAQPNREYRYQVRGSSFSNTVTTTTPGPDVPSDQAPTSGWRVEVSPENDVTRILSITNPTVTPTVNGKPKMRAVAAKDETLQEELYDDVDADVWKDGVKQPLDTLDARSIEPDKLSIELSGGEQLGQRVVERSASIEPVVDFVDRLISDNTSYNTVIDNQENRIRENVVVQEADLQSELQAAFKDIPDDLPLEWRNGHLVPNQTCWTEEGEANGTAIISDVEYSGGEAAYIDSANNVSFSFTLDHKIPQLFPDDQDDIRSHGAIIIRGQHTTSNPDNPTTFNIYVDGVKLYNQIVLSDRLDWYSYTYDEGALLPGDHTITLEYDSGTDGQPAIDLIGFEDLRHFHNFDNQVHEDNGHLDGPEDYPNNVELELEEILTPQAVDQATITTETVSGNSVSSLSLRKNGDGSYFTNFDSSSFPFDYTELAAKIQAKVGLGRRTDITAQDATPRFGYEPHQLDAVTIEADLDTTPVLINRTFDDTLINVLRESMSIYNGVFEVREGDPVEIHVTSIDSREVNSDINISDVEVKRDTSGAVDKATVYAAAETIQSLPFSTDAYEWQQLPLTEGRIVEQTETIRSGNTVLERGNDYELKEVVEGGPPEIKLLSTYFDTEIDCMFKPRGQHTASDVGQYPSEIVRDAPELNSKQMADLAAFQAVEAPYTQAVIDSTITIPPEEIDFEVIDALNAADLPQDQNYQVRDIDISTERIQIRLGAGKTAGDVIQEIQDKTSRVSERV